MIVSALTFHSTQICLVACGLEQGNVSPWSDIYYLFLAIVDHSLIYRYSRRLSLEPLEQHYPSFDCCKLFFTPHEHLKYGLYRVVSLPAIWCWCIPAGQYGVFRIDLVPSRLRKTGDQFWFE